MEEKILYRNIKNRNRKKNSKNGIQLDFFIVDILQYMP